MIPVEGNKHLYRDENSGAIINCDSTAYNQYIRMKEQKKLEKEKNMLQEKKIKELKQDIDEIKLLLKELINGSHRN